MKKILLGAAAFMAALTMNAQEVCVFNADNALGLDSENGTALTAGQLIGETASIVATIGADDTYKPQSASFTVGDGIIARAGHYGGFIGGNVKIVVFVSADGQAVGAVAEIDFYRFV